VKHERTVTRTATQELYIQCTDAKADDCKTAQAPASLLTEHDALLFYPIGKAFLLPPGVDYSHRLGL
jgi:hypothetical protein